MASGSERFWAGRQKPANGGNGSVQTNGSRAGGGTGRNAPRPDVSRGKATVLPVVRVRPPRASATLRIGTEPGSRADRDRRINPDAVKVGLEHDKSGTRQKAEDLFRALLSELIDAGVSRDQITLAMKLSGGEKRRVGLLDRYTNPTKNKHVKWSEVFALLSSDVVPAGTRERIVRQLLDSWSGGKRPAPEHCLPVSTMRLSGAAGEVAMAVAGAASASSEGGESITPREAQGIVVAAQAAAAAAVNVQAASEKAAAE